MAMNTCCLPEVTYPAYSTTNGTYGNAWWKEERTAKSFTQSAPYKALTNRDRLSASTLPRDLHASALVHDPEHPLGIMSMSNVPTSVRGSFTHSRQRGLYSDRQGLWSNAMFNTPGATIDRGVSTYSNLQGAWGRIGPSTYDSFHGNGDWVTRWGTRVYQGATARSLYDHRNVDPRDGSVPVELRPQNTPYQFPY